jgi:YD repeat-containing protein
MQSLHPFLPQAFPGAGNVPDCPRVFRAGQHDAFAGDALFAPAPASRPPSTALVVGTTKQDFQYDGLSRCTSATDNTDPTDPNSASLVTDAYDSLGRVIEETQQIGTRTPQVVSSAWRAANLRSQLTYPSGRTEQYRYDHLDRVQAIYDSGVPTPLVTYTYIGPSCLLARQTVTQAGTPTHTLTETCLTSDNNLPLFEPIEDLFPG